MDVDWSNRSEWLEEIRQQEIQVFKELIEDHPNTSIIFDLGCGSDNYLRTELEPYYDFYSGIDIEENEHFQGDVRRLPYIDCYCVSFGLLYLLNDTSKLKLLKNCKEGVFQINHNIGETAQKLIEASELEFQQKIYPWNENQINDFVNVFAPKSDVRLTEVSYIFYLKND